jgi:(E)-4-hydroxy-3-methyl-but-2-enyl pyrophosphate reductase
MRVLLASPRSFCAGVDRAIETVERAVDSCAGPVYVRKQIVHNVHVVADLERRGAIFVDELDEVPDGAVVVFSAHGVSPAVHAEAQRRGLRVIDATCPLVTKVHGNEVVGAAFDGEYALRWGGHQHRRLQGRGDHIEHPEPRQSRHRQYESVNLAVGELAQAGADVAAHRHELQAASGAQQGGPAR